MLTPVSVALLAGYLSLHQHSDDQRAQARQKADAIARENQLRSEARAYDAAVREDARIHEVSSRDQAIEISRYTIKVQKRGELWDVLGPKLSDIRYQVEARTNRRPHDTDDELRAKVLEAQTLYDPYRPYFSETDVEHVKDFLTYAGAVPGYDSVPAFYYVEMLSVYDSIIRDMAKDLAVEPGSMKDFRSKLYQYTHASPPSR